MRFKREEMPERFRTTVTGSSNMLTLWGKWDFKGEFIVGVIDQQSDIISYPNCSLPKTDTSMFPPASLARRGGRQLPGPRIYGRWNCSSRS